MQESVNGGMGGAGGVMPATCLAPDVLRGSSGHCYRFFAAPLSWNAALNACKNWRANGSLVTVNDLAEHGFILKSVKPAGADALIDLNDLDFDNVFTWESGETSQYDGWGAGQPNHMYAGADEDVAAYWINTEKWHDIPVTLPVAYLCEAPQ